MTIILSVMLFLAFLFCPEACALGTQTGLSLAVTKALPSLFPFFITGNLLIRTGAALRLSRCFEKPIAKIFHLPQSAVPAIVLGLLGGYPVGAVSVCGLFSANALCKKDAERVIAFCNCASPGFCISLVGASLLGSAKLGAVLYGIHAISALTVGFLLREKSKELPCKPALPKYEKFVPAFCGAVEDAAKTALTVTAFLTCFSIILSLLSPVLNKLSFAPIISGLIDLTYGISTMGAISISPVFLLPVLSFLLGFGGLAVHAQVHAIAAPYDLSLKRFTLAKLLHGAISAFFTALFFRFFPISVSVFAPVSAHSFAKPYFISTIIMILLCLLSFCSSETSKNKL